jgi:beta-lactamase superfamily II metal-dependent hydrolase
MCLDDSETLDRLKRLLSLVAIVLLGLEIGACRSALTPAAEPASPQPDSFNPSQVGKWKPGQLEIVLLDVDHGDAQLIIGPNGETLLVDAGDKPYAPIIAQKLATILGKPEVDYFLASHYHIDHIGGLVPLFRDFGFVVHTAVLDRGGGRGAYDSATYGEYYDYVNDPRREFKHIRLSASDKLELGPIKLDILGVGDSDAHTNCGMSVVGKDDNDYSIVLWLTFGKFDYWTAGDLDGENTPTASNVESACVRNVPRPADLMKADHHGIERNNNADLLKVLQPQAVLISLDTLGNTRALLRLAKYGRLFATNRIIALSDDGKTPIIVEDSDDLIVTSRDGSDFVIEGNTFSAH